MPPATVAQSTVSPRAVAYVPAWSPPVLTDRGRAAARLSAFQDCWNDLNVEDRAWFADELNQLLIDAVCPETAR